MYDPFNEQKQPYAPKFSEELFCPLCKITKLLDEFPPGGNLNKKHSWCQTCNLTYQKGYRAGVQSFTSNVTPLTKSLALTNRMIKLLEQHRDKIKEFEAEVKEQKR